MVEKQPNERQEGEQEPRIGAIDGVSRHADATKNAVNEAMKSRASAFGEKIALAARVTNASQDSREPSLNIAKELAGDVEHLSSEDAYEVASRLLLLPAAHALSVIHYFQTVAAHTLLQGALPKHEGEHVEQLETLQAILSGWYGLERRPLVRMQLRLTSMYLELAERPDPIPIGGYLGDKAQAARVSLSLPAWMRTQNFEGFSNTEVPIAADAVGTVDMSRRLQEVRRIPAQHGSASLLMEAQQEMSVNIHDAASRSPGQRISLAELAAQPSFAPFGSPQEFSLLLQHLHEPELRAMICQELGINIVALPLRSQIHLLQYLANGDVDRLRQCKAALEARTDDDEKRDLLDSFFACAERDDMGDVILHLASRDGSAQVFEAYAKLNQQADEIVSRIMELQSGVPGKKYPRDHFLRQIVKKANVQLLKLDAEIAKDAAFSLAIGESAANPSVTSADRFAAAARKIYAETDQLRDFSYLVASLRREDLAQLDLGKFALTKLEGPLLAADVLKTAKGADIRRIAYAQFPNDRDAFDRFVENGGEIFYSVCDNELLGFFCVQRAKDGMAYLDWYSTNPNGVVPGLAEATLVSSVQKLNPSLAYAIVSPGIAASTTVIERLGFVAMGEAKEHEKPYLAVKYVGGEKHGAKDAAFEEHIPLIRQRCDGQPMALLPYEAAGATYWIARIDLPAAEAQSLPFAFFRQLNENNTGRPWVLSRYVPAEGNTKDRQTHYCIFEHDAEAFASQRDRLGAGIAELGGAPFVDFMPSSVPADSTTRGTQDGASA